MRLFHALGVFMNGCLALGLAVMAAFAQADQVPDNPITAIRVGQDQKKAVKVNEAIFQAIGFGNTFLVTTSAGNVIIDTFIYVPSSVLK